MFQNRSKCTLEDVFWLKIHSSKRILRGAFDIKDLQIQSEFGFENLLNGNVSVTATKYTDCATSILGQLTRDIYVSIDLFEFGDWDPLILRDALKLLRYTFDNLFGGSDEENVQAKGLGRAYKQCARQITNPSKIAARQFHTARKAALVAFSALINHLKTRGSLSDDLVQVSSEDRISTATFYELLVRNEAKKIEISQNKTLEKEYRKSNQNEQAHCFERHAKFSLLI